MDFDWAVDPLCGIESDSAAGRSLLRPAALSLFRPQAVLWEHGGCKPLGTLGGQNSYAYAINNHGQIVGWSETSDGSESYHAFLFEEGKMIDLGTLGGSFSIAYSINDLGQIVGESKDPTAINHAFLWERGRMYDLGTLGGLHSCALHINANGFIVGHSMTYNLESHAFLYAHGQIYDLSSPTEQDERAVTITDAGMIYCFGREQGIGRIDAADALSFHLKQRHSLPYTRQDTYNLEIYSGNSRGVLVGKRITTQGYYNEEAILLSPP